MDERQPETDDNLAGVAGGVSSSAADAIAAAVGVGGTVGPGLAAISRHRQQKREYSDRMPRYGGDYSFHDRLGQEYAISNSDVLLPNRQTFAKVEKYRNGRLEATQVGSWDSVGPLGEPRTVHSYKFADGANLSIHRDAAGNWVETRLYMPDDSTYIESPGKQRYISEKLNYTEDRFHNSPNWSGTTDNVSTFSNVVTAADLNSSFATGQTRVQAPDAGQLAEPEGPTDGP